jgi:Mycothiol maleylpyruvate isomerase N-terminal domain
MDRKSIHAAIAQERRGIADLIDSLDESQLATESLCTGWDVKTVGSHLVSALADGTVRAWLRHSMRWRAAARTGQLPRSRQVSGTLLIANTGDRRRKHLVC